MRKRFCLVAFLGLVVFVGLSAWAQDRKSNEADEKSLQKRADEFVLPFAGFVGLYLLFGFSRILLIAEASSWVLRCAA